ncbi:MAG: FAD-dependent monooxygenase [Bauldia sp.]|nr:FAD-dependent monooxygenase [Bauldia sp.]
MKVTVIGAGAAGLGAAFHLHRQLGADVTVLERAEEGETPGLGVALLSFARDELRQMGLGDFVDGGQYGFPISRFTHVFAGEAGGPVIEKEREQEVDYWGIRRSELVSHMRRIVADSGVDIRYGIDVSAERIRAERSEALLLVGADGAGSLVRNTYPDVFQPTSEEATSRYAWLGLSGELDRFLFGYIYLPGEGVLRLTAYPHARDECSVIITHSAGLTPFFDRPGMVDDDGFTTYAALDAMNDILAPGLGGRRITGSARWRKFRATSCRTAAADNLAILGDAYATVHYETGWGTSSALQGARIFSHILDHGRSQGRTRQEALALYARKTTEIMEPIVATTLRVMRQIDAQADQFARLGSAGFLASEAP